MERVFIEGPASTPDADTQRMKLLPLAICELTAAAPFLINHEADNPAGHLISIDYRKDKDGAVVLWVKAEVTTVKARNLLKTAHKPGLSVHCKSWKDGSYEKDGVLHVKRATLVEVSLVEAPKNRNCFLRKRADKLEGLDTLGPTSKEGQLLDDYNMLSGRYFDDMSTTFKAFEQALKELGPILQPLLEEDQKIALQKARAKRARALIS